MSSIPNELNFGFFIPTTSIWDVSPLYSQTMSPENIRELLVRLYQNSNQMALAVNAKDTGIYALEEFLPGQQWFQNPLIAPTKKPSQSNLFRQSYRKVIDFGALPNAGLKSVMHDINVTTGAGTNSTKWTRIYGTATNTTTGSGLPLPYASRVALNQQIELFVTNTHVNVRTAINYSAFNHCVIVLEYLKD